MARFKTITIKLAAKTQTGVDRLGSPIYEEIWKEVEGVLVGEPSTEDKLTELNLTGKHLAYTLAIPKGDENDWTDTKVQFFNAVFRTIGSPTQGIEENIPLSWNKKVKVEWYG